MDYKQFAFLVCFEKKMRQFDVGMKVNYKLRNFKLLSLRSNLDIDIGPFEGLNF